MEPTYDDGDLVLVRESSDYHEGDVIAFRAGGPFDDPTRIIHRIVGHDGDGGFRTQGDNRDRLDPWTPTPDDVIGRAVLHIPMVGRVTGFLTHPLTFAAIGGAAVLVGGERRRRRRRPMHAARAVTRESTHPQPAPVERLPAGDPASRSGRLTQPRWAFVGLVTCAALAAPVLAVAWSALRAPDSTQRVERFGEVEFGIDLDYRFLGQPSAVYPTGEVTASRGPAGAVVADAPLYSRLLDVLEANLAFHVTAPGADRLTSTYSVDVAVETPGGWSTRIQTIGVTPFEGTAAVTIPVDLRAIALQVAAVAELTGVGGNAYTVTVTPRVELDGTVDVHPVQEQVIAPMRYEVADNVITATVVEASEQRELTRRIQERATYSLGALELGTQAARGLVGGIALVVVAGLAWFASVLFGGLGLREPARIAARYRSQIVDVSAAAAPPGPVVMVSAIDELARIAKVEQTVILHEDLGDGAHRYRVFLGTVTYEYEAAPEHGGAAGLAEDAPSDEPGG
jgi:hypothetical protein